MVTKSFRYGLAKLSDMDIEFAFIAVCFQTQELKLGLTVRQGSKCQHIGTMTMDCKRFDAMDFSYIRDNMREEIQGMLDEQFIKRQPAPTSIFRK